MRAACRLVCFLECSSNAGNSWQERGARRMVLATLMLEGVTTDEIDRIAHEFIVDHGAYPSPLGYCGFPKAVCTSVNEIIGHGIPDSRPLSEGDFLNIDVTVYLNGYHGDTSCMFFAGPPSKRAAKLCKATRKAMLAGIEVCGPGVDFREVGRAITASAEEATEWEKDGDIGGPLNLTRPSFTVEPALVDAPDRTCEVDAAAGFKPSELQSLGFEAPKLLKAFTLQEVAALDLDAAALRASGCSAEQLRADFSPVELRAAGFSAKELLPLGLSLQELRDMGCNAAELRAAGFNAAELRQRCFSFEQLKYAGFSASELYEAGCPAPALRHLGFEAKELRQAGLNLTHIMEAGYDMWAMLHAGYSQVEIVNVGNFTKII
ncbi:unnamed protein product [Effrenium voratum]|nr:unnamed protein product [Effrenium voratum]